MNIFSSFVVCSWIGRLKTQTQLRGLTLLSDRRLANPSRMMFPSIRRLFPTGGAIAAVRNAQPAQGQATVPPLFYRQAPSVSRRAPLLFP